MSTQAEIDANEEVFRDHLMYQVVHLVKVLGDGATDESVAGGWMSGFYSGLYVALNDPKVARALIEVYDNKVWPTSDLNDHLGSERIVAAVRKVIGQDA